MEQKESKPSAAVSGSPEEGNLKPKSKLIWTLVFAIIAAASIYAVVSSAKGFSVSAFFDYISGSSPMWICLACICMLAYIFFEGAALVTMVRSFGYKCTLRNGFVYSATDIYFSAITPSATGGQPGCAYFMIKDGIPGTVTTAALFLNLSMYALSIITIGVVCLIIRPSLLFCFEPMSRALIYFGFAAQAFLCVIFMVMIKNERLLHRICRWAIRLGGKLKIIRHVDRKLEKLDATMKSYADCVAMLKGKRWMTVRVFICNLLQRGLLILVCALTFIAGGGSIAKSIDIFAMQSYVVIGTNVIPVPGAMGITDYFMLDAFGDIMTESEAINLELLSRSLSFYSCVIICGVTVLLKIFLLRRKRKKT